MKGCNCTAFIEHVGIVVMAVLVVAVVLVVVALAFACVVMCNCDGGGRLCVHI